MSAAPAYSHYAQPDRSGFDRYAYAQPERVRRDRRDPRTDVSVVPGSKTQTRTLPSSVIFLAKTVAVVFVVFALLGCVRIALSSATVTTAIETRELSSQIESARSEGNKLEVAQSSLSNPTRIKDAAGVLGMYAPAYVANIDISGDVVVVDAAGNLSLSGSAAMLAQV